MDSLTNKVLDLHISGLLNNHSAISNNDDDESGFVQVMAFLPATSSVWSLFTHSVIALNYKFDNLKLITP